MNTWLLGLVLLITIGAGSFLVAVIAKVTIDLIRGEHKWMP